MCWMVVQDATWKFRCLICWDCWKSSRVYAYSKIKQTSKFLTWCVKLSTGNIQTSAIIIDVGIKDVIQNYQWRVFRNFLPNSGASTWWILGEFLASSWQDLGEFLASAWRDLGNPLASSWGVLGEFLTSFWLVLCEHLTSVCRVWGTIWK